MLLLWRAALAVVLGASILAPAASAAPDPTELAMGDKIYNEMLSSGYLLPNSPEAKLLAPVARELKVIGDPLYGAPFSFYVHESLVPNAFYVFGPRVYVNRGIIRLADSREELANVLCHEMSHAMHRDGTADLKKNQAYDDRTKRLIARAEKLTRGRLTGHISGVAQFGENFIWLHHSRAEEERADISAVDLCASAKINPWGLVWMFQKLARVVGNGGIPWFSDHPDLSKRIALLKRHFRQNPGVFAGFNSNEMSATPLWMDVVH